jgi:hypothetical protein
MFTRLGFERNAVYAFVMAEQYRLVFSGEVLEGQHPAVVKKRLAAAFKLDDDRVGKLFSGKHVVVKKAADKASAVQYQRLFEKAGARLQVSLIDSMPAVPTERANDLTVLPIGSDLLTEAERPRTPSVEVNTDHLKTLDEVVERQEPVVPVEGPAVDHMTLAEAGARLSEAESEVVSNEIDVTFDLADVGADLDTREKPPPPRAPDTRHIELADDGPPKR